MQVMNTEEILIVICTLIVLSYLFSIASQYVRIPSVLLLLFAGIGFRALADFNQFEISFSAKLIESLGVVGLIMIVLEAGLDLKLGRDKVKLIRDSFFSALFIFVISTVLLSIILNYWLQEPFNKCIVYAIPLSIMSSSIVIPSIHPLTAQKKEFLVYEASFSDIIGIIVFNYFIAGDVMKWKSIGMFGVNIGLSIVLSLLLSFLLLIILAKTRLNIKFFLIFSLLILIYAGGKIFHLPSLLIILAFGLLINNWEKLKWKKLLNYFPHEQVEALRHLLHSVTAETSFLIRTFFFLLFGFSISLNFLSQSEVVMVGSLIVLALFVIRILYLRFFVKTNLFPESFFIPRGLITIVLFYKIPEHLKLNSFDDGILFYIILTTSIIMTLGMIFYKKKPDQVVEEGQFSE
ncbi:MAG TPA: cation:proton antiporter, partial [Chitinophagaceae bacterium]|nr:cation:proton antiporter [Chitinophagaceae bacterium]